MAALRFLRGVIRLVVGLAVTLLVIVALWIGGNVLRARLSEVEPERIIAPPTGRWVDAGDVQMFVQEWGPPAGPVVVLTHGTGAWSGTWFDTPDFLAAKGWRVVAVDLPPFGFTRTRSGSTAPLDYRRTAQAQRLQLALQAISPDPVVLMGHSFGAGPALEAAMRDPSRVRQLVLVDPALSLGPNGEFPRCPPPAGWPMDSRPLRTPLVQATATMPLLTGPLLEHLVHRKDAVTPDKLVFYREPFHRKDFSAQLGDWAATFASNECQGALSADARAFGAWAQQARPALIWGAQDTVTPPAQGVALGRLSGVAPQFIPDVGHIPHLEDPARFQAALVAAIGEAPRPAPPERPAPRKRK